MLNDVLRIRNGRTELENQHADFTDEFQSMTDDVKTNLEANVELTLPRKHDGFQSSRT